MRIRLFLLVFILCFALLFNGCVQENPEPTVKKVSVIINGTIKSYEQKADGILIGVEYEPFSGEVITDLRTDILESNKDWPPKELVYFLVGSEYGSYLWTKELIETAVPDLQVTILSHLQQGDIYIANNISARMGAVPEDIAELVSSFADSNCTKIERMNGSEIESFLVYSDGDAVNRMLLEVGLADSNAALIEAEWEYRITFYYNEDIADDKESVCLINRDGILINNRMYDVRLLGGMESFYTYWEAIYTDYYSLYGNG